MTQLERLAPRALSTPAATAPRPATRSTSAAKAAKAGPRKGPIAS